MRGVLVLLGAVGAAMPAAGFLLPPVNVMRQGVSAGKLWLHVLERCLETRSGMGGVQQTNPRLLYARPSMATRQALMASLDVNFVRNGTRATAVYEQGVAL